MGYGDLDVTWPDVHVIMQQYTILLIKRSENEKMTLILHDSKKRLVLMLQSNPD